MTTVPRGGKFSTILFDLDGTLVDSYEAIAESLNHARAAFGLAPKPLAEIRREVGRGLEILMAENLGHANVPEGVRAFRSRYRRVYRDATRLLPGVASTIDALAGMGVAMAITSNKPAYFSREIIDALGLGERFAAILGPEMVERPKPDPEMLVVAIDAIGAPRDAVLYVGDMRIDVEASRRAGIRVAVLPTGSESKEELALARPDFLLERFEDLLALVSPAAGRT